MVLFLDIIRRATKSVEIALHHMCIDPVITHLSFTDDLMAFYNGDATSIEGSKMCYKDSEIVLGFRFMGRRVNFVLCQYEYTTG